MFGVILVYKSFSRKLLGVQHQDLLVLLFLQRRQNFMILFED